MSENKLETKNLELNNGLTVMNCPFTKEQYNFIQKFTEFEKNLAMEKMYYRIIASIVVEEGCPRNRLKLCRTTMHKIGKELGIEELHIEKLQEKININDIDYVSVKCLQENGQGNKVS